jgi:sigma-54-specific transcriptional regulator
MQLLTFPSTDGMALSIRAKALVFEDPKSRALLARLQKIAPSEANVLVIGETGTGKELVARHIHDLSNRAKGPFLAVNCGAFSENLIESELFGHEKGAFTGAISAKPGWFEAANGGTLFLDEIGDLPLPMQVKLLRVLQEREVARVGSRRAMPIDVRLIAATNVNLEEAVAAKHFREDLYYRLQVVKIDLLPLRERTGDILPLAKYFLKLYEQRLGYPATSLSAQAINALLAHSWPGNIRELENVLHHSLLVCQNNEIQPKDLHFSAGSAVAPRTSEKSNDNQQGLEKNFTEIFEKDLPNLYQHLDALLIRSAFEYCHHNQLQTARLLGISRNIVRAKLIQYNLIAARSRGGNSPAQASSNIN